MQTMQIRAIIETCLRKGSKKLNKIAYLSTHNIKKVD